MRINPWDVRPPAFLAQDFISFAITFVQYCCIFATLTQESSHFVTERHKLIVFVRITIDSYGAPVYYTPDDSGWCVSTHMSKGKNYFRWRESYPMTTITGRIAYDSGLSGPEKSEKRIVLVQSLINFVTKSERFWLTN